METPLDLTHLDEFLTFSPDDAQLKDVRANLKENLDSLRLQIIDAELQARAMYLAEDEMDESLKRAEIINDQKQAMWKLHCFRAMYDLKAAYLDLLPEPVEVEKTDRAARRRTVRK